MNTLRGIVRFIVGITLLFSGFVKIIDPVGAGIIMSEYLKFMHLAFLDFGATPAASILSGLEMLIGIVLLTGMRIRVAATVSLGLFAFFTILTFFLAVFNPIIDCGCFGEAIKLTNLETFLKNIVLLSFSIFLFLQKDKYIPIAPKRVEWVFTGLFSLLISSLAFYSFLNLPLVDFLDYKAGYDLRESISDNSKVTSEYETVLTYTKDGVIKEFSINNLPDSTWTFTDSKTTIRSSNNANIDLLNFSISTIDGRNITDSILNINGPVIVFTILRTSKLSDANINKITAGLLKLKGDNINTTILTSSSIEEVSTMLGNELANGHVFFTDYKTLVAVNRANAGVFYLNDGVIIKKWVLRKFAKIDTKKLINSDPELVSAEVNIRQQINIEIVAVSFILFLFLMRFVFKLIFIKKMNDYAHRIEEEFNKS